MNKNNEIDKLFERWVIEFPQYKGKLYKDGIVNEQEFEKQKVKLLFITKEPNDPEQNEGDFREQLSKEVKASFFNRIAEWAYGLLNNFPPIIEITDDKKLDVMRKVAFMNIKKTGGKSSVNPDIIKETLKNEYIYIKREIDIISPHIIIGSIGYYGWWRYLFPKIDFKDSYDIKVAKGEKYRIINFYHPSYRIPRAMSYCLLKSVYNSEVFKNL